jgi:hypothetical protein
MADLAKRAADMSKYIMGSDEATVSQVSRLLAECANALSDNSDPNAIMCGKCKHWFDAKDRCPDCSTVSPHQLSGKWRAEAERLRYASRTPRAHDVLISCADELESAMNRDESPL